MQRGLRATPQAQVPTVRVNWRDPRGKITKNQWAPKLHHHHVAANPLPQPVPLRQAGHHQPQRHRIIKPAKCHWATHPQTISHGVQIKRHAVNNCSARVISQTNILYHIRKVTDGRRTAADEGKHPAPPWDHQGTLGYHLAGQTVKRGPDA